METDLNTSTNFYFLNQNFEVIHKLTQYESLMWVDKYDEPGNFEIYAPPQPEIKEAAQVNNYFMSDKSKHLMIVEKLETTVSPTDGTRLIISGRSLESILDRRVLFMKCYFRDRNSPSTPSSATTVGADNLEDAVRQLLEYLFIAPTHWDNDSGTWVPATDRIVPNFRFKYSNDDTALTDNLGREITDSDRNSILVDNLDDVISNIVLKDCEFDKGENALNIVTTIVQQKGLGYQITLDSEHNFVFELIKGKDRTTEQFENPAVIFSPKFNNLKSSKFTFDSGENFRNFVYTEGEVYKSHKPTIVETGEATGLLRREVYYTSDVQHETESSNVTHDGIVKEKKVLTESEYQEALAEDAKKQFEKLVLKTTLESEIEPRLTFQYGRDFGIGDILEVQDGTGNTGKVRCTEFIISHSASGYEEYPTFTNYTEDDEEPTQSSASGGEYSDGDTSKKTPDEIVKEAMMAMMPVGYIYQSTDSESPATKFGFGTWKSLSGYFLRGATSGVRKNRDSNDGGADSATVSSVASHNHDMPSGGSHTHQVVSPNGHSWGTWYGNPVASNPSTVFGFAPSIVNDGRCYSGQVLHTESNNVYNANHKHTINNNGADYNVATLPKYKNVYIWERIA